MRSVDIRKSLSNPEHRLTATAIVLAAIFGAFAAISPRFDSHEDVHDRPVWLALGILYAACAVYFYAVRLACRCRSGRPLLLRVLLPAIGFRLLLVGSVPVLENDLYRYVWDGNVSAVGVSPYRYSPQQVIRAQLNDPLDDDLTRLVRLRQERPGLQELLEQVNHPELPTIYPPVSQWAFECAARTTPRDAAPSTYLIVMKAWMTLFDVGALLALIGILQRTGMHLGWSVAWGWCPLVLKEFANSGHLDSIAVFLTTSALYCCLEPMFGKPRVSSGYPAIEKLLKSAIWLSLAVGAKLYPIVLLPLMAFSIRRRVGPTAASIYVTATIAIAVCILRPMLSGDVAELSARKDTTEIRVAPELPSEPPPVPAALFQPQNPAGGLTAFLNRWEMNDFIFLFVVENLRVHDDTPRNERPWFVLVPDSLRRRSSEFSESIWGLDASSATFRSARAITLLAFVIVACALAVRASHAAEPSAWLESAFLTLAWFWLLAPTQFPWYWCWALVLAPYARGHAWLFMSACSLYYYSRFWLTWHSPQQVWGTPYDGWLFYFYVANWIAYVPWFTWLACEAICRHRSARRNEPTSCC